MKVGRTIPPAAAPIGFSETLQGLSGILKGETEVERFRNELKDVYRVRHASLVSSGKAALVLILKALRRLQPDRDEVLIPAYTCYSVPSAVLHAGLNVRLCDIDPGTLDFDFKSLPKAIQSCGNRLLAVVPVHLYGLTADVKRIRELVPSKVFVAEDAAQAMGGFRAPSKPGTQGDAGFFSLGRGKALSSVHGGIVVTDREEIAETLDIQVARLQGCSSVRIAGMFFQALAMLLLLRPGLFWLPKSIPWLRLGETIFDTAFPIHRISPFQAGLLRHWKDKLDHLNHARLDRIERWQAAFQGMAEKYLRPITGFEASLIRLPVKAFNQDLRERIVAESEKQGLGIMPGYPESLNRVPFLQGPFFEGPFPGAEETARTLLTFPIHPFVEERDIQRTTKVLGLV